MTERIKSSGTKTTNSQNSSCISPCDMTLPFLAKALSPALRTYLFLGVCSIVSPYKTWQKKLLCHQIESLLLSDGHLNSTKSRSSTSNFFKNSLLLIKSCKFTMHVRKRGYQVKNNF